MEIIITQKRKPKTYIYIKKPMITWSNNRNNRNNRIKPWKQILPAWQASTGRWSSRNRTAWDGSWHYPWNTPPPMLHAHWTRSSSQDHPQTRFPPNPTKNPPNRSKKHIKRCEINREKARNGDEIHLLLGGSVVGVVGEVVELRFVHRRRDFEGEVGKMEKMKMRRRSVLRVRVVGFLRRWEFGVGFA